MDRATLEGLIQDIFERGRKKGLAEACVIVDESIMKNYRNFRQYHLIYLYTEAVI